jgi:large subunit ribosomal protein L29
MSTVKELRGKSAEELTTLVAELRKELAEVKRSHKMGELQNSSKLGSLRKQIATALTLLHEVSTQEEKK